MRGYVAFTGRDGAFGWARQEKGGEYALTFSGLRAGKKYTLPDGGLITADAGGAWHGKRKEAPCYLAAEGKIILCDESCISWEEAALRCCNEKKKDQPLPPVRTEKNTQKPVTYRTRLGGESVSALPRLLWPKGCEDIRTCIEQNIPVRVLPLPWRFATVPGTKGQCAAGRFAQNGRVTKTAAAVRARGGLMQPKGLQGYQFVRNESGESFWLLIRDFMPGEGGYAR